MAKKELLGNIIATSLLIIITFLPFTILLILKLNVYHSISWFWVWFGLWGNVIVESVAWLIIAIIVLKTVIAHQNELS